MNTEEIKNIGKKYYGENFIDCISWDNLWKIKSYCNTHFTDRCKTKFLIANLDESDKPGSHWIVLCNIPDKNDSYNVKFGFFDSFGLLGMNNVFKTTDKSRLNLMLKQDFFPYAKYDKRNQCVCKKNFPMDVKQLFLFVSTGKTPPCNCNDVFTDLSSLFESDTSISYNFYPNQYNADICNRKLRLLLEQLQMVNRSKIQLLISKNMYQDMLSKTCGEYSLFFMDLMNREFNEKNNVNAFADVLENC